VAAAHEHFALPLEERLSVPVRTETAGAVPEVDADVSPVSTEWQSLSIDATTVGEKGDVAVLELHGIIDTVSADRLRGALAKVIEGGIHRIVVDMSEVEYVSSGGWGTFTERLRDVRRAGGDIKLFGMDPDVYYVFTMLGFNIVLSSFDLLTAAIEDFEGAPDTAERPLSPEPQGGTVFEQVTAGNPGVGRVPATEAPDSGLDDLDLTRRTAQDIVEWEDTDGGGFIAHLTGPIEASAVDALAASLDEALAGEPRLLLFDLARVTYISSTGWGQFARCCEQARDWGGRVALYGLSADLFEIYRFLEFSAFLPAFETKQNALMASEPQATNPSAPASAPTTPPAPLPPVTPVTPEGSDPGALDVNEGDVDDILGRDTTAPPLSDSPAAPVGPEVQRWPGEKGLEDLADEPAAPVEPAPQSGEPEPHSGEPVATPPAPEAPEDDVPSPDQVDVDGAVSDKNVGRDHKLREMGWDKYGEKLRSRGQPRRTRGKDRKDEEEKD
jgi:anti-anti-sigma factor